MFLLIVEAFQVKSNSHYLMKKGVYLVDNKLVIVYYSWE